MARPAAAICAALAPAPGEVVLAKWRYSAFQRTDLAQRLRLATEEALVIWDVGLGAATNAMAAIRCYEAEAAKGLAAFKRSQTS